MATACPDNNCIALARWPVSETPMALPPTDSAAKRAAAAKAAVAEYFAVVASPTLQADGAAFNRVTVVVKLDTQGAAIKAYRDQLKQALAMLDKAISAGELSVEITTQVPDELMRGRSGGIKGTQTDPKKGKEKTAPKKKDKEASTKKKKKS
jgi:hypothetical protein